MLSYGQLKEMVKEALRTQRPREYERLLADGTLERVAHLRAEAAMETRDWLTSRARDEALESDHEPMERVRRQMMKNRQANEIAIAQATEFETESADAHESKYAHS